MCGRFTLHSKLNLLLQQFALDAGPDLAPRYNIAPTQMVPVIRVDDDGQRQMMLHRWGLIPSWAKDAKIGNRMINARGETVATKPSFRAAFKRRRCLVPADGYFEWKKVKDGKQPYYIHRADSDRLAFAGLWESWKNGSDDRIDSFTIITTDSNSTTCDVHDRMPVILEDAQFEMWLDPEFSAREPLEAMLQPYEGDELVLDPVSQVVNNPRHDVAECIEPRTDTID